MGSAQPVRPYRFYRWYCLIVVIAWNVDILTSIARDEPPGLEFFLLFPLILPAIFLATSAGVFRFPYSAFGPKARTPLPSGPVLESSASGGMVGWANASAPLIIWKVYAEGIGFQFRGVGKGFVPFADVLGLRRRLFGGCVVRHRNLEVRSPLRIPSRRIRRAIETAMGRSNLG